MTLDLQTLHWVFFIAQMINMAAMLHVAVVHRAEVATRYWAAATVLSAVSGVLLVGLDEAQPGLALVAANTLHLATIWLNWSGLRQLLGRTVVWPVLGGLLAAQLGVAVWFTYVEPLFWLRLALLSAVFGTMFLVLAVDMARRHRQLGYVSLAVIAVIHGLFGAVLLARAVGATVLQPVAIPVALSGASALVMMLTIAFTYLCTFSYVLLLSEKQQAALAELASRDGLTGLLNRRAFTEHANDVLARVKPGQSATALLLLDVDRFKAINDCFGHQVGDCVLIAVADAAKRSLRAGDLLGRIGGEEFAVLLPRTSEAQALDIAERVRRDVIAHSHTEEGVIIPSTISIGVAMMPPGAQLESAFSQADRALYRAKAEGRDRVAAAA
jgi:diguanylate cyclase (GGDEF)-like protein